jgi:hypothetical protein
MFEQAEEQALQPWPGNYKEIVEVKGQLSPALALGEPDQRYHNRGWRRKEERAHWTTLVAVAAVVVVVVVVLVSETAGADIESDHQS